MLKRKETVKEENLLLGDYVTVHLSGGEQSQARMGSARENLVQHEDFFNRINQQRGVLTSNKVQQSHNNVIVRGKRQQATGTSEKIRIQKSNWLKFNNSA